MELDKTLRIMTLDVYLKCYDYYIGLSIELNLFIRFLCYECK